MSDWLQSALKEIEPPDQDVPNVRTIFIAGLPQDCTERELHLLFFEGGPCEAIKLQRGSHCTAFVQFPTVDRAMQAFATCKGMVYDPANPSAALRVEYAKADFRRLPAYGQAPPPQPAPPAQPMQVGVKRPWQETGPPGGAQPGPQHARNASTLFIGSIGETVGQAELQDFCMACPGFVRLTMRGEGSAKATAWAEYASPELAQAAIEMLAELPLPSLGRPPNLAFAKSDTTQGMSRPRINPMAPPLNGAAGRTVPSPRVGGGGGSFSPAGPLSAAGGGGASSTLFIGNLDPQVEEQEVYALAMTQAGCLSVSCRNLGRPRATAWAQYESPDAAADACEALKHIAVPSMGRPANIEIARTDSRR